MRMKSARFIFSISFTLLCSIFVTLSNSQDLAFNLPDLDGNKIELAEGNTEKLTAVCFLGTECPLAKLYASRLNELTVEFSDVDFVGVFSNQQDSVEDVKAYVERYGIVFPAIKDRKNLVADQFGAERTPEVFLVDEKLNVRYHGRVDDQYLPGIARNAPTRNDLRIAIQELRAGEVVSVANTEPSGCLIGRVKKEADSTSEVTFTKQISRLLQNHCYECHRQGEIGPMVLDDYDEVVGWADMILEVVDENRMPPWHADPKHGDFINERRMSTAEKEMLHEWVAAGTPFGDKADMPAEPVNTKANEWRLPRDPDVILDMRKSKPFRVPATGTVDYQYFVADPGFKEDKWVVAAEILPGERSVVHHSIVFIRPPDGEAMRGIGWLAAYVPGQSAPVYNPKFGRRIPAGSQLVFQQHYTPTGRAAEDMTRIGMVFGDEKEIENEVFTLLAMDQEFVIPPGESDHQVTASFPWIPKQGQIHSFSPHMHYRGKSFELVGEVNGKQETLLSVPNYDFNWQHIYQMKDPLPAKQVKSLRFTAAFDNSDKNPFNPDPTQHVAWGDQTWEEMAIAFAIVSVPRKAEKVELTAEEKEKIEQREKELKQRVESFVDSYFEKFDANEDGIVSVSELPKSVQRFGSWQIDRDGDRSITREEVTDAAAWRFRSR